MTKPEWFNYQTVIESIRKFISKFEKIIQDGKHLYLVLDNAPWHKKAIRLIQTDKLPEYGDIREKLTIITLPPYSPDLNPIEQVWRITRRDATHNKYFKDKDCLETTVDGYFDRYAQPNEKLSSLCNFKYKD